MKYINIIAIAFLFVIISELNCKKMKRKRKMMDNNNQWGQKYCVMGTKEEKPNASFQNGERRFYPRPNPAHKNKFNCHLVLNKNNCDQNGYCGWSNRETKGKCISRCKACYYITNKENQMNIQVVVKKENEEFVTKQGLNKLKLMIVHESYITGGRDLWSPGSCRFTPPE